jgi:hypothetical protein
MPDDRRQVVLASVRNALNRQAFADWLAAQPAEAQVGVTSAPHSCPIARYLYSTCRVEAEVGNEFAHVRGVGRVPLPLWAQRFVLSVDLLGGVVDADLAARVLSWHAGLGSRRLSRPRILVESAWFYLQVRFRRLRRTRNP